MNWIVAFRKLIKILDFKPKIIFWTTGAIILEAYSRFLGLYDFYIKKEKHYIWEIAKSTK